MDLTTQIAWFSLLADMHSAGLTALALYLTVLSGYLVAAYVVGEELDQFQLFFITAIFLLIPITLAFYFFVMMYLGLDTGPSGPAANWSFIFLYAFGASQILALLGALKFMRDIRTRKRGGKFNDSDT